MSARGISYRAKFKTQKSIILINNPCFPKALFQVKNIFLSPGKSIGPTLWQNHPVTVMKRGTVTEKGIYVAEIRFTRCIVRWALCTFCFGGPPGCVPPRPLQRQPESTHTWSSPASGRAAEAAATADFRNQGQILFRNWRELNCAYLKTDYWYIVHKP